MRTLLATLLVAGLLLSGCASKGGGKEDDPTSSSTATGTASGSGSASSTKTGSGSGTSSSSSTGTSSPAANHAPTASLSVAVNGTQAVFSLKGQDQDGDALTWNLTFGDGQSSNGTALPANATHTYAVGSYNATLSVSDGKDSTTANVTLDVTANAGASATQDASGETTGSAAGCGPGILGLIGQGPEYPGGPAEGVEWVKFDIVPGTIGKAFTWSEDPTSPAIMGSFMAFYKEDDSFISEDFEGAGTVPADSAFAVFYACGPGPDSFTYHAG